VKTIYSYVQRGIIPHMRMESNVRFSKHQVLQWFRETQLPAPTGEERWRQAPVRHPQYPKAPSCLGAFYISVDSHHFSAHTLPELPLRRAVSNRSEAQHLLRRRAPAP
jgi:hypothetical protein